MVEIEAAGTVHDLANVLAVLSASAAMLEDDLADLSGDHPARETASRMALATARAGELCERLRRPQAAPKRTATFDLADAVRDGVALLGPTLEGVEATLTLADDLPVRGRPLDALQVLLNLVLNATAAAPGGSIVVRTDRWVADRSLAIAGRLVPGRDYARVIVEDSGPGFGDDPHQLFQPGATTSGDPARGRGLAVVAAIAEAAGGGVRVERSPVGGARVAVCWPLRDRSRDGLADRALLIVGGSSRAVARLADAGEATGAEVSLCLDPDDAIGSVVEDIGAWDGVIVAGAARGLASAEIERRLRAADPTLPVVVPAAGDRPGVVFDALERAMERTPRRREGAA